MSRILRRPMFRGGPVSSYGTGIATGLGYNDGGRVGYSEAGPVKSYEQTIKDEKRKQEILSKGFKTEEEFMQEYDKMLLANEPQILYGIDEITPGGFIEKEQANFDAISSDSAKNAFVAEKLAEQNKIIKEAENLNIDSSLLPKNETPPLETPPPETPPPETPALKSDKEVMQEYMDMFKESLGGDKDELNRQRYLEIAKFGANLMAQPGGQSLGEAVGKAGSPALEGFSKIDAAERAGDRQAKTLGFQAALRQLEDSPLEKNIKDLSKYMSKDEAIKVATRQGEATNNLTKRKIIDGYAADIQSSPGAPSSAVIVKGLAETIFDYTVKEGKNISDFAPLTEKTTIEKDKLYYDKEGKIYKGKDDGTYIKVELSTSNE